MIEAVEEDEDLDYFNMNARQNETLLAKFLDVQSSSQISFLNHYKRQNDKNNPLIHSDKCTHEGYNDYFEHSCYSRQE